MQKTLLFTLGAASLLAFNAMAAESVPYNETFDGLSGFPEGWKTEDVNKDNRTWEVYFNAASVHGNFFETFDIDDWLFTTAISLEKGKTYLISFKPKMNYNQTPDVYPSLEVKFGTTQSVAGLTETLMATTPIKDYFPQNPTRVLVSPDADGDYYIGFHATGTATTGIELDDLSIKEALMPTAVTDITVTKTGTYGQSNVKVSFRAPATDASGKALPANGLSKIVITRSGMPVTTIENPVPGELIEIEDNPPYGSGNYVWRFVPYGAVDATTGEAEEGFVAESDPVFVGINVPATPEVKAVEDGHTGTITISWDPVTTDRNGEEMPAEFIDYQILFNGEYLVSTGAESPYTFQACNSDEQVYVTCAVVAKSSYGSGTGVAPLFVAGAPYTSYSENFVDAKVGHDVIYGVYGDRPGRYAIYDDSMLAMAMGILDGDADKTNGCFTVYSDQSNSGAFIGIGKFDVSNMAHPALTFYTYFGKMYSGSPANIIELYSSDETGNEELVYTYNMADHSDLSGWQKVTIPLDGFKDKMPVLKLAATIINMQYVLIDHIALTEVVDNDLCVASISAPNAMKPGVEASFTAVVENSGKNDMEATKAVLAINGREVTEATVPALKAGEFESVSFSHALSLLDGDNVEATIKLMVNDDNMKNNTSSPVSISNKLPRYPAVTDLSGSLTAGGAAKLEWSAPESEMPAEELTESFEEGEDFGHSFGDWTFVDNDKNRPGNYDALPGFEDYSGPFIANGELHSLYKAHSGEKCLCFMASETGATEDYAISPALSGEEQTVSFCVRGYDPYGYMYESFKFLTSVTGNAVEDFTEFESDQSLDFISGREWKLFSFNLPAGTTYFAIKYCPAEYSGIALMVDDVTYILGDTGEPLELLGYNVYRSRELITSEPVTETTYTDASANVSDNIYQVTAVYNRGESAGSNSVVLKPTAIDEVTAAGLAVGTGNHCIVLSASEPTAVKIYAVDGTLVASVVVKDNMTVNVAGGMYLVAGATGTHKVIVK